MVHLEKLNGGDKKDRSQVQHKERVKRAHAGEKVLLFKYEFLYIAFYFPLKENRVHFELNGMDQKTDLKDSTRNKLRERTGEKVLVFDHEFVYRAFHCH